MAKPKPPISFVFGSCLWILFVILSGCDVPSNVDTTDLRDRDAEPNGIPVSTSLPVSNGIGGNSNLLPQRNATNCLIASFNIQVFGESKAKEQDVMQAIAAVIRCFDLVAIQEVRSLDPRVLPTLIDYVNELGANYQFLIGPRLGRTNSQEQYAYVFDANRMLVTSEAYTIDDGRPNSKTTQDVGVSGQPDLLHREPFVAHFQTRAPNPFSFTILNVHTDPDVADQEVDVLHDVYLSVRNFEFARSREDDVLMTGDFNAPPDRMSRIRTIRNIFFAIQNQSSMVQGSKLNDNLIFDRQATAEFTGRSGVLSLTNFLNVDQKWALRVSDHNPIWAEFSASEGSGTPQLASQANASNR